MTTRGPQLCFLVLAFPAAVGLHRLLSWLRPRSRIVVKLGGSACTNKAAFETVHEERLQATANQLAQTRPAGGEDRVLLHGAGSFGHFQARQYGGVPCKSPFRTVPLSPHSCRYTPCLAPAVLAQPSSTEPITRNARLSALRSPAPR